MNAIGKVVNSVGDLLVKAIYLHLLWILFTLAGLLIFGFMPATASVFSIIRKWLMKEKDVPVFRTFRDAYRSFFVEANLLGLVYTLIGLFLYLDLRILHTEVHADFIRVFVMLAGCLYLFMGPFLLPIYVHMKLPKLKYMTQSFLIVFARPFEALLMVISLLALYYLFLYLPVLFIFAGSTIVSFPLMWIGMRSFKKVEAKQTAYLKPSTNMK